MYKDPHDTYFTRPEPEDKVEVVTAPTTTTWREGLKVSVKAGSHIKPSEMQELYTLKRFLSNPLFGGITAAVASARNLCRAEAHAVKVCADGAPSHMTGSFCAAPLYEAQRCHTKLARKIQHKCRAEVVDLAKCYEANNVDPTKAQGQGVAGACFKQWVKFDVCVEDF